MASDEQSGFSTIDQDAKAFLEAYCRRFPAGTVRLESASTRVEAVVRGSPPDAVSTYTLTPTRTGAAGVVITVRKGEPTVVMGIGQGATVEWNADFPPEDAAWLLTHVERFLSTIAAGRIRQVVWRSGQHVVAVDTDMDVEGQRDNYTCRIGFGGLIPRFLGRAIGTWRAEVIEYVAWVPPAV